MKKFTLIATVVLLMASVGALYAAQQRITASKRYVTTNINNPRKFSEISVAGSHEVNYTQSRDGSVSVSISCPENLRDYLDVRIDGNKLIVAYKRNLNIQGTSKIRVVASSPELTTMSVAGSGDIRVNGNLNMPGRKISMSVAGSGDIDANGLIVCGTLGASVAGSGDVELNGVECDNATLAVSGSGDMSVSDLRADKVKASVSGSGDLVVKGTAAQAEFNVAGSGDLVASSLNAGRVKASVAGSGDLVCRASSYLNGSVAGSGTIAYYGNPAEVITSGRKSNFVRR